MSDGIPTEEQLRRIERGVQRRIDRRREAARGITGAAVVIALLGGGLALVLPFAGSSGGGSTSGSAGGSAASSAALQTVRCHDTSAADSAVALAKTPVGSTAEDVAAACGAGAVDFQSGSGRMPAPTGVGTGAGDSSTGTAEGTAAASPSLSGQSVPRTGSPAVVCRGTDDVLEVFPADDRSGTLCERLGLRPF